MQVWQYVVIAMAVVIVAVLALSVRQFIIGWKTPVEERTAEKSKKL